MTVFPIQLLRNSTLGNRPNPTTLLPGQPAVNINIEQPGLFFADSTGNELIKIGPCSVSETPPDANPSLGESWIEPNGSAPGVPMLWLFDGTDWRGVPLTETFAP